MDGSLIPPWTLCAQLGTAALLAVFFAVFARASRRPEVNLWLWGWICEGVASAASLTVLVASQGAVADDLTWASRPLVFLFALAKTLFALVVVRGVRRHLRPNEQLRRLDHLVYFAAFWGLLWSFLARRWIDLLLAQWTLVALVLALGAWAVLRQNPDRGSRLLPRTVLAGGLVYLAYVPITVPALWGGSALSQLWRWSALGEAAVDVAVAVAMLIILERSRADRFEDIYHRLQNSHDSLRRLADVDPLTGLANRRKLREVLEEAGDGSLVSLDLDGFKEINDVYGHEIGDSCLTWTARTLRRAFRPTDQVFRLGGDEFLVVAPSCDPQKAAERVHAVGVILGQGTAARPPLTASHGIAALVAGQPAERALREANRVLHEQREARRRG